MPWRESNLMDERLKFVARLLDGEKMALVCREFRISRKTGYKIFNRYKDCGLEGLTDQSRRPYRHANQLPFQVERAILRMKQDRPSWGGTEDPGEADQNLSDDHAPCEKHRACGIGSSWSGETA